MKKISLILVLLTMSTVSVFASIKLETTGFTVDVQDGGKWIDDDRTEFTKKKAHGIIEVPHPVLNKTYIVGENKIGQKGEVFATVNECSGMDFAFGWSAVRVMAVKTAAEENETFFKQHMKEQGGKSLKIISKDKDTKTGEWYYRYSWTNKDGVKVNGYNHGKFYQKETLVNLTMEWTDDEGKAKVETAFDKLNEQVEFGYAITL